MHKPTSMDERINLFVDDVNEVLHDYDKWLTVLFAWNACLTVLVLYAVFT